MLFSAYRRDEYADPDGFVAQLGLVLEGYDEATIIAVTDPRTGIQRRSKWPPTIAEVVEACEAETVARATRERYAKIPTPNFERVYLPPDNRPGRRANVFVPADNPRYSRAMALIEKADPADWKADEQGRDGIWISLALLDPVVKKKNEPSRIKAPTDDELRAFYAEREPFDSAAAE